MSKHFENNNFNEEPNNFGLPGDYFQKSAASILNKIEWMEEHKEFKRLLEIKKETGFVVPENYFDNSELRNELLAYPALATQNKKTGFNVPANYFEEAETNELSKVLVNGESERENFLKLNAIKKQNPFTVKEGYFENSAEKIIASTNKPAKVIGLFSAKVWYSAAAAIFAITIGIWVYNQFFVIVEKDCGTLACVDKQDLIKTKNLEALESDELYELVDTKKLEEKLEKKPASENKKDEADTSLKNVSTEDLLDEI